MEAEPAKLFIGGISWDTDEDRLREYFQTFGEVVEAVIMKDRTTGRARGFGFVVFADSAVAERVVKEKHMIDGRTVEAKKAVPRDDQQILNRNNGSNQGSTGPARTKKIFVGGLASTVTENDFKKYFDQFGAITDVVVMYDHNTQRPRGFGFITYDTEEAVDKVLLKTFHELNGKMVEVKRAVPKELSPGPTRSHLGTYNYGLSRVNSFLNAYTQGYNRASLGGYGVRMDGQFSPLSVGRSGYSPFGPTAYGLGSNFEPGLTTTYGDGRNFSSNFNYGRGLSSFYGGSSNRYGNAAGYVHTSGNGSVASSASRNMWGNASLTYATNSGNGNFMGSRSGSAFGSMRTIWGSTPIPSQGGEIGSAHNRGTIVYGSAEPNIGSGGGGYGRNNENNMAPASSSVATNDSHDGVFGNFYGASSVYGDSTWQSLSPELDGSGSFDFGFRTASDVRARDSIGHGGGYSVASRSNRGIAS